MIRREHDPVPCSERCAEPVRSETLDPLDAGRPAEIARENQAKETPPEFPALRRHEAIGFRDDDVLHVIARLCPVRFRSRSCGYALGVQASRRNLLDAGGTPALPGKTAKYGYAKNRDGTFGGLNDFDAHIFYGKVQYKF
jgi:hypothetical protein